MQVLEDAYLSSFWIAIKKPLTHSRMFFEVQNVLSFVIVSVIVSAQFEEE